MNATRKAAPRRLIVAVTGASGAVYGIRILERLRAIGGWETHLVVSEAGVLNAFQEYGMDRKALHKLADVTHNVRDIGATIASGSFLTAGMVIAPCSMKTLGGVAHALADNLITRAADVILKERRRLVLITRETPLNLAHIRNMEAVTLMGGIIFPSVPAFYTIARERKKGRESATLYLRQKCLISFRMVHYQGMIMMTLEDSRKDRALLNSIDWSMTPEEAVTLYLEWGNNTAHGRKMVKS